MASLKDYDISMDELRVALTYINPNVVIKPVPIQLRKAVQPFLIPTVSNIKGVPGAAAGAPAAPAGNDKKGSGDDDFDVFGDDEEGEEPKESRAEMMARLKKEAEERTARKEAKQRTLVAIEIKPFSIEQDLMALWKKITENVVEEGLKWGESCTLADVAFGIKKIQCTFTMGIKNSSDDIIEKIMEFEDEVQSAEVTSMNVL